MQHGAGVSVSTASLVFSGKGPVAEATGDRVRAAATELGFTGPNPLASSLRQGRSGAVSGDLGEVGDPLHRQRRELLRGIGDGQLAPLHPLQKVREPVQVHPLDLSERSGKSMGRGYAAPRSLRSNARL